MTDRYRPGYHDISDVRPPPPPPDVKAAMYYFQGNNGRNEGPKKASYRTSYQLHYHSNKMSERPLLTSRQRSPDQMTFGAEEYPDKFRDLNELTDTDETEMEFSEDEVDQGHPTKRMKTDNGQGFHSLPKWSNPDPYTSLPPPDEMSRKKKDVVKLIRKARNNPNAPQSVTEDAVKENQDFISFDMDGQYSDGDYNAAPANAPVGPRSHREQPEPALGKRKRSDDAPRLQTPPSRTTGIDGNIRKEWRSTINRSDLPWMRGQLEMNHSAGIALHKEVVNFYDWIKPKDYEAVVRANVVDRLDSEFARLESGELRVFGSYAAGLYLPTGDLDLVYFLRGYNPRATAFNGLPPKPPFKLLHRFASFLRTQQIAEMGTVLVISHAKVPIIKFVDKETGLKVDLCFNNNSGLPTIETYEVWKSRYPLMPILVSIIKHFLMVRGLNDVATGGLGGFSAICLVTSLVQHMPVLGQPTNAGQFLLEFFNLYGNLLNRDLVAIRLEPPGYIDRTSYARQIFSKDKRGRLMIIDPNRPENNISGGTDKIATICACFAEAYNVLQTQLAAFDHDPLSVPSFLETILGSDYSAYEKQRDVLYELHHGSKRKSDDKAKQPPIPALYELPHSPKVKKLDAQPQELPFSVHNAGPASAPQESTHALNKSERRAMRLKTLRPDIARKVPKAISVQLAMAIGGYNSPDEFAKDMENREAIIGAAKDGHNSV